MHTLRKGDVFVRINEPVHGRNTHHAHEHHHGDALPPRRHSQFQWRKHLAVAKPGSQHGHQNEHKQILHHANKERNPFAFSRQGIGNERNKHQHHTEQAEAYHYFGGEGARERICHIYIRVKSFL